MATIQLRNLTGRTLNRTQFLGDGYVLEPPERIEIDATAEWTTADSGSATYIAATATTREPRAAFTLAWDFQAQGQFHFSSRDVRGRLRVRTQATGETCVYAVSRRRRKWPIPPRNPLTGRPLIPVPAAVVTTLVAAAALALGVLAHGLPSPPGVVLVPSPTATLFQTSTLEPSVTTTGTSATATATATPGRHPTTTATATATATIAPTATATATTPPLSATITARGASANVYNSGMASVSCQAGEHMIGGGFTPGPTSAVSYPTDSNTWTVIVSDSFTGSPFTLNVYAICLQANFDPGIAIVTNAQTFPSPGAHTVQTVCPTGSVITGGGWNFVANSGTIASSLAGSNAWVVSDSGGGANDQIQGYALCAKAYIRLVGQPSKNVSVSANNYASASLACGQNQLLSSGGFTTSWANSGRPVAPVEGSWPTDASSSSWSVTFQNTTSQLVQGSISAVCISY